MTSVHMVVLACSHCRAEHLHEVTYAGRVLASTVCSNCGWELAKDPAALRRAWITDMERRVRTKPLRLLRSAVAHPVTFARALPGAVLVKPAQMTNEWRVLHGRRAD